MIVYNLRVSYAFCVEYSGYICMLIYDRVCDEVLGLLFQKIDALNLSFQLQRQSTQLRPLPYYSMKV